MKLEAFSSSIYVSLSPSLSLSRSCKNVSQNLLQDPNNLVSELGIWRRIAHGLLVGNEDRVGFLIVRGGSQGRVDGLQVFRRNGAKLGKPGWYRGSVCVRRTGRDRVELDVQVRFLAWIAFT
ncbi:hypothetical protein MA16_Dca002584 [Dendrobium catenatum]|uniref:Uncharacterized protein n=1 Tax=Dendrobium catenatum TaxID=906689 RepID=A0A2I0W0X5_9ASPA|nr:hypothetical protein MA16_Dca002584 [Dendrobium catenatum]